MFPNSLRSVYGSTNRLSFCTTKPQTALHPPAIPGVGFATIGGWVGNSNLFGGPKWRSTERGPGTKWRCVEIYTPSPDDPPRGSVQPPLPPLPPPTPEFGRIRGGMGGYAQFAFSTRIRPFFNVSWNSSNSACFGCFFTQPRKHTFLHFFCQFQGVPGNPSKRRIPTPIPGGNPSAVYVFYSVLDTICTA